MEESRIDSDRIGPADIEIEDKDKTVSVESDSKRIIVSILSKEEGHS